MASDDQIDIKVTATTDGLTTGLNKATGEVKDFGDQINDLAQRVASVKPDAFKALAEEFNAGKLDLDEFRDGLIAVTTASSAAATESVALAEASHLSAGGMRELVVVGRELASGNLTRLPGSLSILATRLNLLSPAGLLGAAGIAAVGFAIYEIIDSSEQAEANLNKLQNAFTAVGRSDLFNTDDVKQYIDDLRQIPDVTADAATSIVNEFARTRNGAEVLPELVRDVKPLADALGIEVPQAAKLLADALNDPVKGLQDLRKYGVDVTAAQQEQITSMMAVNNVAGAQSVLLDAISVSISHVVDTSTGTQRFFNDLKNDLSGVNEQATGTRVAIDALIQSLIGLPNASTRNLPGSSWTGSSGDVSATDKAKQTKEDNDAIGVTDKMFETGNSLLREQEVHKQNILKIQEGINAAESTGNDAALKRGYADLETENKRYYGDSQPKDDSDKVAEAEAKAAAEGADAQIKEQREVVEEKRRLGEISVADSVRQLEGLAAQEHAVNLKRIADMQAVYERQGDRAGIASTQGDTQKENARYAGDVSKIDSEGQQNQQKIDQANIESDAKVAESKIKTAEEVAKQQYELGESSSEQELATLTNLAQQQNAIAMARFDELANLYKNDLAKFSQLQDQKKEAEEKFNQQMDALNAEQQKRDQQREQQEQQQFQQSAQRMIAPWESALTNMSTRTNAWQQATTQAQRTIETNLVSGVSRMVANWLLGENEKTAASAIGAKLRQLSDSQGTNQSVQDNIAATGKQQQTDAVGVFSSVFNYLAPELGPFAAVPAAVASAAVLALSLPSAAGGMIVPNDTLAMVHENEMVLPARYTSGLTSMIDQANAGGGGGGGHTFNNTFNMSGVQPKDIPKMIDSHIQKQARNGAYGGMRSG